MLTLLNSLVPNAEAHTQEVSAKTGQGKQTTTQAIGHVYKRDKDFAIIADLPGMQNFGIHHLTVEQIRDSFPEIVAKSGQCKFQDCRHRNEPDCAVRAAVELGSFHEERYNSYLALCDEIDSLSPY